MANKKHEHNNCQHEVVKFCKDCNNIYCNNCDMEWFVACNRPHHNNYWSFMNTPIGTRINDNVNSVWNSTTLKKIDNVVRYAASANDTQLQDADSNTSVIICKHGNN